MSEYVSAEVTVNVGELPNTPGFKVSARIGMGPENSSNIRGTFRDKTSEELEDLSFYLVIVAKTEDGAGDLNQVIQKLIDKVISEEELPGRLSELRQFIAKNDDEEFEGMPKFVATSSVHRNHVIVKFKPVEGL